MQEFFKHTILTDKQLRYEAAQVEMAALRQLIRKLQAEIADKKIYKKRVKLNLN